jgi:hypothetical protein
MNWLQAEQGQDDMLRVPSAPSTNDQMMDYELATD